MLASYCKVEVLQSVLGTVELVSVATVSVVVAVVVVVEGVEESAVELSTVVVVVVTSGFTIIVRALVSGELHYPF